MQFTIAVYLPCPMWPLCHSLSRDTIHSRDCETSRPIQVLVPLRTELMINDDFGDEYRGNMTRSWVW